MRQLILPPRNWYMIIMMCGVETDEEYYGEEKIRSMGWVYIIKCISQLSHD